MTGTRLIDAGQSPSGWSKIGKGFKCLELYAYSEVLHLVHELGKPPIVRGSLGHVGSAHYYYDWMCRQQKTANDTLEWKDAMGVWVARHPEHSGQAFLDEMVATLEKYIAQNPEPPGRILAVEHVVTGIVANGPRGLTLYTEEQVAKGEAVPVLVNGQQVRITRRMDLIVAESERLPVVVWDHKFRNSAIGEVSLQQDYEADEQFSASRLLMQALGWNAPIRINGVRVGTGKAYRPLLPSAKYLDERFAFRLWAKHAEIQRWLESGIDPTWWPNSGDEQVCRGRYGNCECKDLCLYGAYQPRKV